MKCLFTLHSSNDSSVILQLFVSKLAKDSIESTSKMNPFNLIQVNSVVLTENGQLVVSLEELYESTSSTVSGGGTQLTNSSRPNSHQAPNKMVELRKVLADI